MDWAARRKRLVLTIFALVGVAVVAIIAFAVIYETPSCLDKKQNQDEVGIDCGGSCSTICTAEAKPASVRFARALTQSGRTDVIAYIDNPNREAGSYDAHLTLDVYEDSGRLVRTKLEIDLPPGGTYPLYVPGIATLGSARQAFLSFDEGFPIWTRASASGNIPLVGDIRIGTPETQPRIIATLTNQTARPIQNIPVIVSVFDASGIVIAASQTLVPELPAQGTASAIFTWNEPFAAPAARIEIVPVPSLPSVVP